MLHTLQGLQCNCWGLQLGLCGLAVHVHRCSTCFLFRHSMCCLQRGSCACKLGFVGFPLLRSAAVSGTHLWIWHFNSKFVTLHVSVAGRCALNPYRLLNRCALNLMFQLRLPCTLDRLNASGMLHHLQLPHHCLLASNCL
jgi:hypothetical protein